VAERDAPDGLQRSGLRQAVGRGMQGGEAGRAASAPQLGRHQQADLWTRPEPQKERAYGMNEAGTRTDRLLKLIDGLGEKWSWLPLLIFTGWALFELITKFAVAWMEWYRAGGLQ